MAEAKNQLKTALGGPRFVRLLGLAALILLLQIPVMQVDVLISERWSTHRGAVAEVTQKWGGPQTVAGPRLLVPLEAPPEAQANGRNRRAPGPGFLTLLPSRLQAEADVTTEIRYRGIHGIPLYRAALRLGGHFDPADAEPVLVGRQPRWDQAVLVLGVADPKGIRGQAALSVNGAAVQLAPGAGPLSQSLGGFQARVTGLNGRDEIPFELNFGLAGSEQLNLAPMGRQSELTIRSDWADPSFQGNRLPSQREVGEDGFEASWDVPYLSRNYPQAWVSGVSDYADQIPASAVGVRLVNPLDSYGQTRRSVKYELMFISLTLLGFWLFEVLGKVRIHPVQYLFLGLALCLFYLLLLSLAEHLGFLTAYLLAMVLVVAEVSLYTQRILKDRRKTWAAGGGIAALYLFLLALVQQQDYALLAGSLGLFLILGAVMHLTRDIDWYAFDQTQSEPKPDAPAASDRPR